VVAIGAQLGGCIVSRRTIDARAIAKRPDAASVRKKPGMVGVPAHTNNLE
jgi:hypothetical protein